LSNEGNTIKGAGDIGDGSANLNFTNALGGRVDATGALTINTGSQSVENDGAFEAASTGKLTIKSALFSNGDLLADGGTIAVDNQLTGSGVADIENNGTLDLATAAFNDVYFADGTGMLQLGQDYSNSDKLFGDIYGFQSTHKHAKIDLQNVGFVSANNFTFTATTDAGILAVDGSGGKIAKLTLAGDFVTPMSSGENFHLSNDGHGGTFVTFG
jgi:hypothetical protein